MATLKWKRGKDWPNSGDEFMVAESPRGLFTIKRSIRNRVDPWYELHLNGSYTTASWVMKNLKRDAEFFSAPPHGNRKEPDLRCLVRFWEEFYEYERTHPVAEDAPEGGESFHPAG